MIFVVLVAAVALLILTQVISAWKRRRLLEAMSDQQRRDFLAKEALARKREREVQAQFDRERAKKASEWQEKEDCRKAEDARQQIAVAKAEGRHYARVWVPQRDVECVMRWAAGQSLVALQVKEGNKSTDILLSISGF